MGNDQSGNKKTERKRILIMSVYAPSELNKDWYRLQKHFINKNTLLPYDFKIITNNVNPDLFAEGEVVCVNENNLGHPAGIKQILDYMRDHQKNYDAFLILDSDAFPVGAGWHELLNQHMLRFDKNIAAPIRYENLDIFPHPCVVYMNKEGLNNPRINFD
jgi:hypothetical protein